MAGVARSFRVPPLCDRCDRSAIIHSPITCDVIRVEGSAPSARRAGGNMDACENAILPNEAS